MPNTGHERNSEAILSLRPLCDISSRSIPDVVHVKNLNYLEEKKNFEVLLPPHISNFVPGIQLQ